MKDMSTLFKKTLLAIAIAGPMTFSSTAAYATGIPVIDIASLANELLGLGYNIQEVSSMTTQIENQYEQIERAEQEVTQATKQVDAISGVRDLGNLLNSPIYRDSRQYLPSGMDDALNGRYGALRNQIVNSRQANRRATASDYGNGDLTEDNSPALKQHEARAMEVEQQSAFAKATYEQSTQRTAQYQQLVDQINTTTDLKAAIDLNSRIAAETLMATNELIKQQALSQQQAASSEKASIAAGEQRAASAATHRKRTKSYSYDTSSSGN